MKLAEFKLLTLLQILKRKNKLKEDWIWIEYKKDSILLRFIKNLLHGKLTYGGFPICNQIFNEIEITRWEKDPERSWLWKKIEDRAIKGEEFSEGDFEYIYSLLKKEINLLDRFKIWVSEFQYKWNLVKLAIQRLKGEKLGLKLRLHLIRQTYNFLYNWFN